MQLPVIQVSNGLPFLTSRPNIRLSWFLPENLAWSQSRAISYPSYYTANGLTCQAIFHLSYPKKDQPEKVIWAGRKILGFA